MSFKIVFFLENLDFLICVLITSDVVRKLKFLEIFFLICYLVNKLKMM